MERPALKWLGLADSLFHALFGENENQMFQNSGDGRDGGHFSFGASGWW
jgi:hypothetical protein